MCVPDKLHLYSIPSVFAVGEEYNRRGMEQERREPKRKDYQIAPAQWRFLRGERLIIMAGME